MPQTTKPNEQRRIYEGDFTWERFAKDCFLNKYALVVGSEVILNRDIHPEINGNSTQLLFDKTLHCIASTELEEEHQDDVMPVSDDDVLNEYHHLKRRHKNFSHN